MDQGEIYIHKNKQISETLQSKSKNDKQKLDTFFNDLKNKRLIQENVSI